uniref:Uncharacterized protein n=1 Tax=Anguilla anguilla TaxID=7936 RepID=A0A0E9WRH5_ANGAN
MTPRTLWMGALPPSKGTSGLKPCQENALLSITASPDPLTAFPQDPLHTLLYTTLFYV